MVTRLDLGDGAHHRLIDIANILGNQRRIERRLPEFARDLLRIELGVRPVIPCDHQCRQPLLRSPHIVGHDGNSIVEPHDLVDALDSLGRRIIHVLQPAAEDRDCAKLAIFTPAGVTSMP